MVMPDPIQGSTLGKDQHISRFSAALSRPRQPGPGWYILRLRRWPRPWRLACPKVSQILFLSKRREDSLPISKPRSSYDKLCTFSKLAALDPNLAAPLRL